MSCKRLLHNTIVFKNLNFLLTRDNFSFWNVLKYSYLKVDISLKENKATIIQMDNFKELIKHK